jgi:hypothetical protein
MLVLWHFDGKNDGKIREAVSRTIQINSLEGLLMIEWDGLRISINYRLYMINSLKNAAHAVGPAENFFS